jgi:hypothetical protein
MNFFMDPANFPFVLINNLTELELVGKGAMCRLSILFYLVYG